MNRVTSALTTGEPPAMKPPAGTAICLGRPQFRAANGLFLLYLLLSGPTHADFTLEELEAALKQEPTNKPLLMEVVRRYHKLLLESPTDETWKSAERHFDTLNTVYELYRLRRGAKVDALALAYSSSYSVLRSERLTRKGSRLAKYYAGPLMKGEAMGDLDIAVQTDPANIEIRLIRAFNGYALRGKERLAQSVEDLRYVILACERDPQKGTNLKLPHLYLVCGKCAKRSDNYVAAFDVWRLLVEKYPESEEAKEAAELLRQLQSKSGGQPKPKRGDSTGEGR